MCRKLFVSVILLLALTSAASAASDPYPANGAENVTLDTTLSWSPDPNATSHDVYFGTNFEDVNDGTLFTFKGNQDANSYDPGGLEFSTTYYWRTDTVRQIGEFFIVYTGSVWSFTTEATPPPPPSAPTNPSPSDGATDQSIDVGLSWSNGGGATSYEVYFGTDPTPDSGEYKGSQTGTSYNPGTLNYDTTYYWRINALNSSGTTTGEVWSFTTSGPVKATNPSPADGAIDVRIDVVLGWNPGYGATSHDVYFDTSSPPAFIGNQTANDYDPGTLEPGVVYYWQINEVNNPDPCSPWQGDVWSFTTVTGPVEATNPYPADGAEDVPTDVILGWDPGYGATSHDVYFDTSSPPAFIGNQTANDYDPGTLEPGTTYFWQIDGVNNLDPCSPWQGDVWSFTTVRIKPFEAQVNLTGTINGEPVSGEGYITLNTSNRMTSGRIDFSEVPSGWNAKWPSGGSLLCAICTNVNQPLCGSLNLFQLTGGNWTVEANNVAYDKHGNTIGNITQRIVLVMVDENSFTADESVNGWYNGPLDLTTTTGYSMFLRQVAPGEIEGTYTQIINTSDDYITTSVSRTYTYSGTKKMPFDEISKFDVMKLEFDGQTLLLEGKGYYEPVGGCPTVPGDINKDGCVDFKDLAILADNWLAEGPVPCGECTEKKKCVYRLQMIEIRNMEEWEMPAIALGAKCVANACLDPSDCDPEVITKGILDPNLLGSYRLTWKFEACRKTRIERDCLNPFP